MSNRNEKKYKPGSVVEFSGLLSTILGSQRTFLSMVNTVSVFAGLAILIKNKSVLIIIILLFLLSIYNFYKGYGKLIKLINRLSIDEEKIILEDITQFNTTLYGYCLVLILIFVSIIKHFSGNYTNVVI